MSRINKIIADRYILKELIGQGGMADVYLAQDKILQRDVAIKILRSSLTGDPIYVTRFHREASAAAALRDKNIVQIFDVGEDGDNYYIVMEYVPGHTLKELIHKRGALHYAEAIDVMKQVVSATSKAHALGIVHRDLKPQNILVTDSGVVKIADFGIASIQSLSQVTQTDTIMGSLHYLAPEIARGEKASNQSDLYALGIVFYELLRGEVPFNGDSPVNIALKHMRDDIPSIRSFNSSIPQSVENIIIKATAKNTKDRYSFAKEMLEDLSTCLNRENEDKLVFKYEEDTQTIIADNEKFFTKKTEVINEPVTEKKDKKKLYVTIGAIVSICVVLFALLGSFLFGGGNNFPMPNVIGLKEQEAIKALEEKNLIVKASEIIRELSEEYEEGIIISTNPIADSTVREGDTIILTISTGKYLVVNNYVGEDAKTAEKSLEDLGFTVVLEEVMSEEKIGVVVSQSLEAEKLYDPKTTTKVITLQVSKGVEITVPNVYGQTVEEAKKLLEGSDFGFVVRLEALPSPTNPAEIETMKLNVVMTQSIQAFTKMIKEPNKEIVLGYYDQKPDLPVDNPTHDPITGDPIHPDNGTETE